MADSEFQLEEETEQGWNAPAEDIANPIATLWRNALGYLTGKSRWFNRVHHVLFKELKMIYDAIDTRLMWTTVQLSEVFVNDDSAANVQPPQQGTLNNLSGFIFRKTPAKPERLYFSAIAKHADGKVKFGVTAEGADGNVNFAVGRGEDLDGPFTVYNPPQHLQWKAANDQPEMIEVATGTLTVGKEYFYYIERGGSGNDKNEDVAVPLILSK